ncbi:TPR repeat-containing protein [Swaminathania salitolerans LMG 21291]|nr:TPR repeat-containing protein [Swaminathania salitolerans LMG 21291]
MAFLAGGAPERAEALFREILSAEPAHPGAWHGLACVARDRSKPHIAIACAGRALQAPPDDRSRAVFTLTLAAALDEAGHRREALSACRVALLLEPRDPRGHMLEGELLHASGERLEARRAFDRAIALASDPAPLLTRIAGFLMRHAAYADAAEAWDQLALLHPGDPLVLANRGAALFEAGQMEAARTSLEQAMASGGDTAETTSNLALVEMALGHFEAAQRHFDEACRKAPDDVAMRINRASFHAETGEEMRARETLAPLAALDGPDGRKAAFNLATLDLSQGRYEDGWRGFESRLALGPNAVSASARWTGEKTEKRVRITAEQGLGDMIQFLRFLPEAASRAPLLLDLPPTVLTLIPLMPGLRDARASGRVRLAGEMIGEDGIAGAGAGAGIGGDGSSGPSCSLLSLPHLLGMRSITAEAFLERPARPVRGRVGLFWAGSPAYRFDARRSVPRDLLAPVLALSQDLPDVEFLCLQHGARAQEQQGMIVPPMEDLAATAEALARCSIVVGVDTALAHLAGALGVEFWLLDRYGGDWRWKGPDWYPAVRIFRCARAGPAPEVWPCVIARLAGALRDRLAGPGS